MVSVLVSDKLSKDGIKILEDAGLKVDVKIGLSEDEIVKIIGTYEGMIVRSETKVTPKIIKAAHKMKIIGRAGVGVDNIDIPSATQKGIVVVNSPEGNTIAAAEHTVAMLLAMSRNIPQAYVSLVKGHTWDRSSFKGVEVFGKTLGIIGLGKIGSHVAKCMLGMGMKVLAHDPFASKEYAEQMGIELVKLEDVITKSDYISLHIPKTDETKGLINKARIATMKDGVRIVNCARGGIIVEADLAEACKSGKVAAASIDVFDKEPTTESPLFECSNVVAVPHLGASTEEAQVNVAVDVAQQIAVVLNGGDAISPVNIPNMKPALMKPVKPYVVLAEKLGKFAGQIVDDAVVKLEITYLGEIAKVDPSPLTTIVLKGLLEAITPDGSVNFVNAPFLAKEQGLEITETKSEEIKDFANSITIKVTTKNAAHTVSGSLFVSVGERITNVDGFAVDAVPEGNLLIFPNEDKPGIVGRVGYFLGEKQINIAGMEVGRDKVGGKAIMLINVDEDISMDTLEEISKIEGIRAAAKLIKF